MLQYDVKVPVSRNTPDWVIKSKHTTDTNIIKPIEAYVFDMGCLGGLLDVNNVYFGRVVGRVFPAGLRLEWAGSSDAEAPFLELNLCMSGGAVSAKVCDRRDDFDFDVVGFPFLDGGVPRRASCGVCVFQLIGFARASSHLNDFNCRNGALAAGLLRRGCRCFGLRGFIAGTVPCWKNVASVWERFCSRMCRSPSFTVTWCADLEGLWVSLAFRGGSEGLLAVVGKLAVAWVLCGGLRAWLSARSLLVAVLRSLVARRRFGPQTQ